MKKLMEHNEVLIVILLSLMAFSLCLLMVYDNYNTHHINEELKTELYKTRKQVQDLKEEKLELDLKLMEYE